MGEGRAPSFPERLRARFEPVRLIASGGFGSVWEARQEALGRAVALKLLHAGLTVEREVVQRFTDEARVMARLSHPGIVKVLDHGVEDGLPWMACELIEGESLAVRLREGPLPWRDVVAAGRQVALALEEARRHGVVHRDVKPGNIIADGGRYAVTDFGISKWSGTGVRTEAGLILGTPAYIAPEQVLGEPPTHATDLYALGVTLYELATGRVPFEDSNPVITLQRQVSERPAPLRGIGFDAPPALDLLVQRLLAKEPRERPATAAEVAMDLAALVPHGGELPGRATMRPAGAPPAPAVAARVAAALLGAGALVLGAAALRREPHQPPPVPPAAVSAPAPSAEDPSALQEVMAGHGRLLLALAATHDSLVRPEDCIQPEAREKLKENLARLAENDQAFLQLFRRARRCHGPGTDRLLPLENLGHQAILDSGGHLRVAEAAAVSSEFRGARQAGDVVSALTKLATELEEPPADPYLALVARALAPIARDVAGKSHFVSDARYNASQLESARDLRALDPGSFESVMAQATILQRVAYSDLSRTGLAALIGRGALTDTSNPVRGRAELLALIPAFLALVPQHREDARIQDVALWMFECAAATAARGATLEPRRHALDSARALLTGLAGLPFLARGSPKSRTTALEVLDAAARELADAAAAAEFERVRAGM